MADMTTGTQTATAPEQDRTVEEKISQPTHDKLAVGA
jgi:hypothetical protein